MHIMFTTNFYSPDEINYCKGCDKTNRLQEEIFNLEEDMGIIKDEFENYKNHRFEDREDLVCEISRLIRLLEEWVDA